MAIDMVNRMALGPNSPLEELRFRESARCPELCRQAPLHCAASKSESKYIARNETRERRRKQKPRRLSQRSGKANERKSITLDKAGNSLSTKHSDTYISTIIGLQ